LSEFTEAVKEKLFRSRNTETQSRINKQQVKASILNLCDEYIKDNGDILTFESTAFELPYVVEAITEEPLKSKYNISQISETLFQARAIEFELEYS
jgi:predicted nuclease of restriction endonuclease-like RecB superfamily